MKPVARLTLSIFSAVLQISGNRAVGESNAAEPLVKPKPDWTVEDVLSCEMAYEFAVSPDCRWAAWVKTGANPAPSWRTLAT
jgi:hypothetical protein